MPNKPKVFIGSSSEGLPIAKAVKFNLGNTCETHIWNQGVFGLSEGTMASLVKELPAYDFAILILTADDKIQVRGESKQSPRDNVLLEFGLCIGILGLERTFAVYDPTSDIRIPTDLAGVTLAPYDPYEENKDGKFLASLGNASTIIDGKISALGLRTAEIKLLHDKRQINKCNAPSRVILFDIDGTVLGPQDNLQQGTGLQFVQLLHKLADKGYYFVFITGNNFDIQQKRIITPIKDQNLGSSVFCFSDGGSRSFEFNPNSNDFDEIGSYSDENLISPEIVENVIDIFKNALQDFLLQRGKDTLLKPHILWHERTLDHLDTIIFPLNRSFTEKENKPQYEQFCKEVKELFKDPTIQNPAFKLIQTYPGGLIIRAHGRNTERDVMCLQDMIHTLLSTKEYRELSKPEHEIRGGKVACQIALKPFNDDAKREEFRKIIKQELDNHLPNQFSVLLGGRTTIDIQVKGVDKGKAVRFFLKRYKELDPKNMIYFGNEFGPYGNDRAVLDMSDDERPGLIINVGDILGEDDPFREKKGLLEDNNGPIGTLNYLKFLLHETL